MSTTPMSGQNVRGFFGCGREGCKHWEHAGCLDETDSGGTTPMGGLGIAMKDTDADFEVNKKERGWMGAWRRFKSLMFKGKLWLPKGS